jgi:hypothetical protein
MDQTTDGLAKKSQTFTTPSKIPVAKNRLTFVIPSTEKTQLNPHESTEICQSTVENVSPSSALLENESDPCVESEDGRRASITDSSHTSNFQKFREKYLELKMPRFSDVHTNKNQADPTQQQSIVGKHNNFSLCSDSMTDLKNYSTQSSVCNDILDEIKEKIRNSNGNRSYVFETGDNKQVVTNWKRYEDMVEKMKGRPPLRRLLNEYSEKMKNLIESNGCEQQIQPFKSEYVGTSFPETPSFTFLWKNYTEK